VQCAAGMRMYDPIYLALLRNACDRYGVHLIADEIAVGFGRTGTLFACEQASIRPDFVCLSKGLTSGYLPLSAVVSTEDVYTAFYDEYVKLNAFLHSHSFTGNPLCCAVAAETLKIFADDNVLERNRALSEHMGSLARPFVDDDLAIGQRLTVEGSAGNHIVRVLRSRVGDELTIFNGRGGEYGASIEEIRRDTVQVGVRERRDVERESRFDLTLAQGISRGERMDWVVQKATELGVTRIVPVFTERSVVQLDRSEERRGGEGGGA